MNDVKEMGGTDLFPKESNLREDFVERSQDTPLSTAISLCLQIIQASLLHDKKSMISHMHQPRTMGVSTYLKMVLERNNKIAPSS